ncbi:hypothetical protein [Streptomyces lunalinharesii]|uniref:Uncharacterized protein n=1 Tax=Streptomyces lunalinharesii TaxID=333384 RepID=A0ABN3R4Z7_9ACTN
MPHPHSALLAHDVVRTLGTRRILDGLGRTASPGHRIGLIGENGPQRVDRGSLRAP